MTQLSLAKDNLGIAKMVLAGQAFFVPGCTHAKIIDTDFSSAINEVRIMDGKMIGAWAKIIEKTNPKKIEWSMAS